MAKTVFFGGTFNPPHIAHRLMLEAVAKIEDVEKILVIPTNLPPHKDQQGFTASGEDRLIMCRLLTEGVKKAEVSDMELKRGGKSYSFDTLSILKPLYQDLFMIIGGDMITSFTTWFRYKDILKLCGIFAVRRPGIDNEDFLKAVEGLRAEGGNIIVIDTKMPDVSSTQLRKAMTNSENRKQMMIPENIMEYIRKKGLYVVD